MANGIYNSARYSILTAGLNWPAADILVAAWGGEPDFVVTDKKISDIVGRGKATVLGTSLPVTTKSVSADGTAQTNQVVIPGVPVGQQVTFFTLGKNATPVSNSDLFLFLDDALNLPFDPNGLDIVVQPDWLQARGWFRA